MPFYDLPHDRPGEKLARKLETLRDYRVLRRLPRIDEVWVRTMPVPDRTVRLAVVDAETTGLDHDRDRMIELAIGVMTIDPIAGDLVGIDYPRSWFEDPGVSLPPEIVGLTGITPLMLDGHRFPDREITTLLAGCDALVAHNARFDAGFVQRRFPTVRQPWCCSMSEIDWAARGFETGRSIGQLLTAGGFFLTGAHRADVDAWATMCLLSMGAGGERTLAADLFDIARRPTTRLFASGAPFACKAALKAAGYRWSPDRRVWWIEGDDELIRNEQAWLEGLSPKIWPIVEEVTWFDRHG